MVAGEDLLHQVSEMRGAFARFIGHHRRGGEARMVVDGGDEIAAVAGDEAHNQVKPHNTAPEPQNQCAQPTSKTPTFKMPNVRNVCGILHHGERRDGGMAPMVAGIAGGENADRTGHDLAVHRVGDED